MFRCKMFDKSILSFHIDRQKYLEWNQTFILTNSQIYVYLGASRHLEEMKTKYDFLLFNVPTTSTLKLHFNKEPNN